MDETIETDLNLTPFEQAEFNVYVFANGLYADYMLQLAYPAYLEGLEELEKACQSGNYFYAQELAKKLSDMETTMEIELNSFSSVCEA